MTEILQLSESSPDDMLSPSSDSGGDGQIHKRLDVQMTDEVHPDQVLVYCWILYLQVKVSRRDVSNDVEATLFHSIHKVDQ